MAIKVTASWAKTATARRPSTARRVSAGVSLRLNAGNSLIKVWGRAVRSVQSVHCKTRRRDYLIEAHPPAGNDVAVHVTPGYGIKRQRPGADLDPAPAHLFFAAGQQRVPFGQRLAKMNPAVGTGVGQPVVFGHRVGRQTMAVGHPLGAVFVVHAAHGFQVQEFAGHAVDGDLAVVDLAQQAALSTTIAQGFPLLAVELAEGVALPEFFTHDFSSRRPAR